VSGQGIKDVAFVTFGRLDAAVPGTSDPALGVFNIEPEAIGSTTIFNGQDVNLLAPQDAGLYRAPFVKN
jgi:energy-converting hydrogenase Eha subunit E